MQKCKSIYRFNTEIKDSQICAGGKSGEDSCGGDSGGPLMAIYSGKWTYYGIVSFGLTRCGTSGFPGIYTRVTSYLEWIVGNLEE